MSDDGGCCDNDTGDNDNNDTGCCDTADNDTGCHDTDDRTSVHDDHHSSTSQEHTQGHADSLFDTLESMDANVQRFINDFTIDGETLHQPINTEHFGSVFHARPYDDNYRYYNSTRYKPTRIVLSDHGKARADTTDMQICVVLAIVALVIILVGFGLYIRHS